MMLVTAAIQFSQKNFNFMDGSKGDDILDNEHFHEALHKLCTQIDKKF
jgi:hypothetical protein